MRHGVPPEAITRFILSNRKQACDCCKREMDTPTITYITTSGVRRVYCSLICWDTDPDLTRIDQ